jgi:hypothetical protein
LIRLFIPIFDDHGRIQRKPELLAAAFGDGAWAAARSVFALHEDAHGGVLEVAAQLTLLANLTQAARTEMSQ